jgi:hypothetical protein
VMRDDGSAFARQLIELRDAAAERRPALTSFEACLPVMVLLDRAQRSIDAGGSQ